MAIQGVSGDRIHYVDDRPGDPGGSRHLVIARGPSRSEVFDTALFAKGYREPKPVSEN